MGFSADLLHDSCSALARTVNPLNQWNTWQPPAGDANLTVIRPADAP